MVPPSGGAASTASEPMTPPEPPRFSTTTVWPPSAPSTSCSPSAVIRATTSAEPPGAKGAAMRIGRPGSPWAQGGPPGQQGRGGSQRDSARQGWHARSPGSLRGGLSGLPSEVNVAPLQRVVSTTDLGVPAGPSCGDPLQAAARTPVDNSLPATDRSRRDFVKKQQRFRGIGRKSRCVLDIPPGRTVTRGPRG